MRRAIVLVGILAALAVTVWQPAAAHADSVSIGVQTDNMSLGINIGPTPPPLVVVPGPVVGVPVYTAPSLPYNYFVYRKAYYLYHEGHWFRARRHAGPWTAIAIAQVPRPILLVPVEHYRSRPEHWEHHGPPPWAREREREREWRHARERDHEHGRGHGKERGHGKDRD